MALSRKIQFYVDKGLLTQKQALALNFYETMNLKSETIRTLITDGTITMDEAIALPNSAALAAYDLKKNTVRALIDLGFMTTLQALRLSTITLDFLECASIRALIDHKILTYPLLEKLQPYHLGYLRDNPETIARLCNHEISIEDMIVAVDIPIEYRAGRLNRFGNSGVATLSSSSPFFTAKLPIPTPTPESTYIPMKRWGMILPPSSVDTKSALPVLYELLSEDDRLTFARALRESDNSYNRVLLESLLDERERVDETLPQQPDNPQEEVDSETPSAEMNLGPRVYNLSPYVHVPYLILLGNHDDPLLYRSYRPDDADIQVAVRALKEYGLTKQMIYEHWRPSKSSTEYFNNDMCDALRYLVSGALRMTTFRIYYTRLEFSLLNPLPIALRLTPEQALAELSELPRGGDDSLLIMELYEYGLRGDHLRAYEGSIELFHKEALGKLLIDYHMEPQAALDLIRGTTRENIDEVISDAISEKAEVLIEKIEAWDKLPPHQDHPYEGYESPRPTTTLEMPTSRWATGHQVEWYRNTNPHLSYEREGPIVNTRLFSPGIDTVDAQQQQAADEETQLKLKR